MDRSRLYKNYNKDAEHLRQRRQDQSIELRKLKKEQNLNKKRNIVIEDTENVDPKSNEKINYEKLIKEMQSPDTSVRFTATQLCRRALSHQESPPIDEFVKRGAVQILIRNLDNGQPVLFETAWALTNIASGSSEHTLAVVKGGAVPKLISILSSSEQIVVDQCIWALGNIAGDSAELRNCVIEAGVIQPTIAFLEKIISKPEIVKNVAWMLSNLLRHKKPSPPARILKELIPVFKKLLKYSESAEVVSDSAWAISYASDSSHNFTDAIISSGVLTDIVPLLYSKEPKFIHPSLRIFGNLVIGDDDVTQIVLEYNFLPALRDVLAKAKSTTAKEVCWLLSNVAAGTIDQKQMIIDLDLVQPVLNLMENGDYKVRKETVWCISNLVFSAKASQIEYLLNQNVLKALSSMLTVTDKDVIKMIIETLTVIFNFAVEHGLKDAICEAFEACQGLDKIESLQTHEDDRVYTDATKFLEEFFDFESVEEEGETGANEEQQRTASAQHRGDQLQFAMPSINKQFDF